MYEWRKMNDEERAETLRQRKERKLPWHSPPRVKYEGFVSCIFTAACYEHQHIIGKSAGRMAECEDELLKICADTETKLSAWCVLPNHYHLLIRTKKFDEFKSRINLFHGRSARKWNLEDEATGRKVWCNYFDRRIKSNRHFWASLNYINNNPVYHGYVSRWQDWIFSGAAKLLGSGRKRKSDCDLARISCSRLRKRLGYLLKLRHAEA